MAGTSPEEIQRNYLATKVDEANKKIEEEKQRSVDISGLPYANLPGIDIDAVNVIRNYLSTTGGGGRIELPSNLEGRLTTAYNPFAFTVPEYQRTQFSPFSFTKGSYTAPEAIQSVADLPDNIKEAIYETARQRIGRTAAGQRISAQDRLLQLGRGATGLNEAAQRGINQSEMEMASNLAIQQAIEEANRRFQENQNVRGLRLGQEQTIANNLNAVEQARAANEMAANQANMLQNQYQTGLADTIQTRNAAEAEKKYNYDYGKQQDIINTIMNQASFNSAERQNEASRQQAAIQQGLNYLNQGGTYRLNAQQLAQKGNTDLALMGGQLGQAIGNFAGGADFTGLKTATPRTYSVTRQNPNVNPNQNGGYSA